MNRRRPAAIGTQRLKDALCPYCGVVISAATGVSIGSTEAPRIKAGDESMCCYCLNILHYDGRFYHRVSHERAAVVFAESKLLRDFRDSQRETKAREAAAEIASKTGRKERVN